MPDIIAILETKLEKDELQTNIGINGYNFIHSDSNFQAGGIGLYIKNSISYKIIDELDLKHNFVENIWIEVETKTKKSIAVGVVYRHPGNIVNQIELFTKAIKKFFLNMSNKKMEFYFVSDFNINLLQSHCNQIIKTYVDNFLGYSVKCCINKPTRISVSTNSLLDHIYTNDFNRSLFSGIALCDISDHLPIFIFIKDIKYMKKKSEEVYIRDMKIFSEELFCQDLYKQLGDLHVTESRSLHDRFEAFVKLFTDIVNFYAPRRRATRKEKKLKSKPWVTQGLLKSIKLKNKMYKQSLMHPSNYQFDKYKKYRNVLNRAIESAKQNYYNKIVTEEKHKSEIVSNNQ